MRSKILEKVSRKRQGIEKLELEFRSLSCLNATLLQVKKFLLFYLPPSLPLSVRVEELLFNLEITIDQSKWQQLDP